MGEFPPKMLGNYSSLYFPTQTSDVAPLLGQAAAAELVVEQSMLGKLLRTVVAASWNHLPGQTSLL